MSLQPDFLSSSELNALLDEGFLELGAVSTFRFRIRHPGAGEDSDAESTTAPQPVRRVRHSRSAEFVIPAEAGIHTGALDSRLRRNNRQPKL